MKLVTWPLVAALFLVVGVVAWCLTVSKTLCECGCEDRLPDGECLDCGCPAPVGVNP